jgi:hypothetical protein
MDFLIVRDEYGVLHARRHAQPGMRSQGQLPTHPTATVEASGCTCSGEQISPVPKGQGRFHALTTPST